MNSLREIDIKFVKGIGPKRAELLNRELGIHTAYDLVRHFPSHYIDRSKFTPIREFQGDMPTVLVKGHFVTFTQHGEGAKMRLVGLFTDGTASIEVVWFRNIRSIAKAYHVGNEYILFGKPEYFAATSRWSMVHPEVDSQGSIGATTGLRGVYPLTERLRQNNIGSRQFFTWIQTVLTGHRELQETLPPSTVEQTRLLSLDKAIRAAHCPTDNATLQAARLRLKFEELFYIQVDMLARSRGRKAVSQGLRFPRIGNFFNRFYNECLPFSLTEAQKRVIREIRRDVDTGHQMNRLVQGDVGSGKTLVALMAMLIAVDNGAQACLMAPTEILSGQHYETLRALVAPIGVNVRLLTGSTRAKERREIHAGLLDGSIHILIGTHAVLEDIVQFKNLGMAVIDEQHRFGVAQRSRMWAKNTIQPHILVMTATPIPRTLAMTVYGDLDVSVIDELPPGRKPVMTLLMYEQARLKVWQHVSRQVAQGFQVYIVYPLIEENQKLDLKSLEEGYELVKETFPQCNVAFVHGKQKPAQKDYQMELFASGKAQILVATTVIEVGVNVPNATTMIIENAERFGLSQLHQLRGRVGRGGEQSYCVLMSKVKIAGDTRKRLELMTQTTDGFRIAEADMSMRGPGDIEGTMQSGIPFDLKIANLATDGQVIQLARDAAARLLDEDPYLTHPANRSFAFTLAKVIDRSRDWSRIS
jgi:ATP-dependent DNA helicase RecG